MCLVTEDSIAGDKISEISRSINEHVDVKLTTSESHRTASWCMENSRHDCDMGHVCRAKGHLQVRGAHFREIDPMDKEMANISE